MNQLTMKNLKKLLLVAGICIGLTGCYNREETIMIVNMGDSYTSGDGTKLKDETWEAVISGEEESSLQCHRTKYNRTALAVSRLQEENPNIKYVDVSCSGATIFNGVLGPFGGHKVDEKSQLPLDSQIDQVKEQIDLINPDNIIIVLSIGGNDIGFSAIVAACSFQFLEGINPWGNCQDQQNLKDNLQNGVQSNTAFIGLDLLPAAYDKLAQKINKELQPDQVLITEYPDPTKDSNNNFCGGCQSNILGQFLGKKQEIKECIKDEDFEPKKLQWGDKELIKAGGDFVFSWGTIPKLELIKFSLQNISDEEMAFAYNEVLTPLNNTIKEAAKNNNWIFVGGLEELSLTHGVCSDQSWFNTFDQSWQNQENITGVLHPNKEGHQAFSEILETEIRKIL